MEVLPFPDLNIADFRFLDEITERFNCSKCGKSRMYYCYSCFLPLDNLKDKIPQVKLPIKVDVIKHPGEVCGKSTAVHAAVLAPEDVNIYIYPDIPEFDPLKTVLLYPCEESRSFKDYINTNTKDSCEKEQKQKSIERIIFIDSTWFQANKIFSDPKLKEIPKLEIKSHDTKFWRYQLDKPTTYLSTIEAIYYCIREYDEHLQDGFQGNDIKDHKDDREISKESKTTSDSYDNLLFFFSFFYNKIRRTADKEGRTLKSYSKQRKPKIRNN